MVFNFPMTNESTSEIEDALDKSFNKLPCTAKVNVSFGCVLQNTSINDTGLDDDGDTEYRYFYAHDNVAIFDKPIVLQTITDVHNIKDRLDKEDVLAKMQARRPDTKWRFHKLTNVTISAYLMRDIPLGCREKDLPDAIRNNHYVNTLLYNSLTGQRYNDHLCMFRGVALFFIESEVITGGLSKLESASNNLFSLYIRAQGMLKHFFLSM